MCIVFQVKAEALELDRKEVAELACLGKKKKTLKKVKYVTLEQLFPRNQR